MGFDTLPDTKKILALQIFNELLQNEQQKSLQALLSVASGNTFGGTSVTALVKAPTLPRPLTLGSYDELAEIIAESYVSESKLLEPQLGNAFSQEECDLYMEHGIFYGVHVSPKLLALVEGLVVEHKDLLIQGFPEPYQLHNESLETIGEYFVALKEQRGLDLDLSSLVLADTTTPEGFEGKKILNPTGLNEKLVELSELVTQRVREKGRKVDSLYMISTDTDSPHRMLLSHGQRLMDGFPLTPGLTMCGSTASIEGFDFKYIYRIGLIAQGISNNIISSRIRSSYSPFTFIGMLSPFGYTNGALPTNDMGTLRYEGNIDLRREFLFQYEGVVKRLL